MSTFRLQIVTPEKVFWDEEVDLAVVRTSEGNIGIKANHVNYIAKVEIGKLQIHQGKQNKIAAISGGIILVDQEKTTIVTDTAEWPEEIDLKRAQNAKKRAENTLAKCRKGDKEFYLAEMRLKRALNRINLRDGM